MTENDFVLIVGAGPTGLTAAIELSRQGIAVRIIDKLTEARSDSRALAIQARTLELFKPRGMTDELLALGNRAHAATIYRSGTQIAEVDLGQVKSVYNYMLMLPQSETERILTEKLSDQGVAIERGVELIAVAQAEVRGVKRKPTAILKNKVGALEELIPSYIISAEGAHSMLRNTLGLKFKGREIRHNYALADLHIDGDVPESKLSIFSSDRGFIGVFPIGKNRYRLMATDPQTKGREADAPHLEDLQRIWNEVCHIPAKFYDMIWSSRFVINSRHLKRMQKGPIFFGGDSAHIHSPAGGQGMNTGIQDMINLSWKIALVMKGIASPELLATYEKERLPIIKRIVKRTELATEVMNSTSPIVDFAMNKIAPRIMNASPFQSVLTGFLSEISANYRASRLSKGESKTFTAGDRVPASKIEIDGAIQTLDAIIKPDRFTVLSESALELLLPEKIKPYVDVIHLRFIDESENSGQTLIIRPDGYIGYVGSDPSRWFKKVTGD